MKNIVLTSLTVFSICSSSATGLSVETFAGNSSVGFPASWNIIEPEAPAVIVNKTASDNSAFSLSIKYDFLGGDAYKIYAEFGHAVLGTKSYRWGEQYGDKNNGKFTTSANYYGVGAAFVFDKEIIAGASAGMSAMNQVLEVGDHIFYTANKSNPYYSVHAGYKAKNSVEIGLRYVDFTGKKGSTENLKDGQTGSASMYGVYASYQF